MTANPKPPAPSAEAQRRAAIKHRRETSTFWMAIHLLGSLKVAVILLATIAGVDRLRHRHGIEIRFRRGALLHLRQPAVHALLVVLALNLLCAAFTRWPWQKKHLGFVVTHAGIILMLTGAVVGKTFGFEAFVTLDKTKPPESRLIMHEDILTIDTSSGVRGQIPFNTEMHPPTEARPFSLPLENSTLKLVVDRATENLVPDDTLAASSDPVAPPGVALHFINAGLGQNVAANLMQGDGLDTFDFFGLAKIEMVDSLDEAHPPCARRERATHGDAQHHASGRDAVSRDPSGLRQPTANSRD